MLQTSLPFRIESDRWGNIVMSPPRRSRHGEYQLEIGANLRDLMTGRGLAITELGSVPFKLPKELRQQTSHGFPTNAGLRNRMIPAI